jgi:dihydroorotate dehydrogenase (NAD+) catalytic subunit
MPKYDLSLNTPLMNAAGSLGFSPFGQDTIDLAKLGAFVTNPVSLPGRTPASGKRFLTFPGGFLMHTGHPNPGLNKVIRRYASHWRRSPLPIIVHVLGDNAGEIANMLARLESIEGVMGIEIGVPPDADRGLLISLVEAATGELPVVMRLPLDRSIDLAPYLRNSAIAAISLGPPRGALPGPDASLIHGRLYGPAIFPLAVAAVKIIHAVGVPVIGAGGVYKPQDAELMLSTGAIAVQLDSVLWRGDYG